MKKKMLNISVVLDCIPVLSNERNTTISLTEIVRCITKYSEDLQLPLPECTQWIKWNSIGQEVNVSELSSPSNTWLGRH